jgi:predicted CXXCH cytochrome family protein
MKRSVILFFLIAILAVGCARTWVFQPIESYRPSEAAPPPSFCQPCHQEQFESWMMNRHSDEKHMAKVPIAELHGCAACHDGLAAHAAAPAASRPPHIPALTKTEKNTLCGKCHYNQRIFGSSAINPHDKHALFTGVALEGQPKQIACLDCHSGHKVKAEMLVRIKAHICYECHTSAMFTMGIFQPFNYLTFGKACQACHTVHGGSAGERWGRMGVGFCVVCHFAGVALVD